MAERFSEISVRELEYALAESLDNIRLTGTVCASDFKCSGQCEADVLIALFDACEDAVSRLIFHMDALLLKLTADSDGIYLRLQIDTEKELSMEKQGKWEKLGGIRKVKREGDTMWIFFTFQNVKKIRKGDADALI